LEVRDNCDSRAYSYPKCGRRHSSASGTHQGNYAAAAINCVKGRLARQAISGIVVNLSATVVSRALTNFEGGLTILREAGEDAVNWLIILVATI